MKLLTNWLRKGLTSIHRTCGILERVAKMAIRDDRMKKKTLLGIMAVCI
jgi:hypothetical protein